MRKYKALCESVMDNYRQQTSQPVLTVFTLQLRFWELLRCF